MFKHLPKLFVLVLISIFVVNPAILVGQQKNSETYEAYLARIRKEIQPFVVQIMIIKSMREGRDRAGYASGFPVFEQKNQIDLNGRVVKYVSYFIMSTPHIVSEEEGNLKNYQENNTRVYILGKNKTISAQVVAWEWGSDSLLLRVDIEEKELEDFKIQVVKFAKELPGALFDSKYDGKDVPSVYLAGYPSRDPIVTPGHVSRYYYNYNFNEYAILAKVADVNVSGSSGPGQSGGPVFNQNLEVAGMVVANYVYQGINFALIVPIDVIAERFLKKLPELKGVDLPSFELDPVIKNKPIFLGRPKNVTINN